MEQTQNLIIEVSEPLSRVVYDAEYEIWRFYAGVEEMIVVGKRKIVVRTVDRFYFLAKSDQPDQANGGVGVVLQSAPNGDTCVSPP